MSDLVDRLTSLREQCTALQEHLDLADKQKELDILKQSSEAADFWNNPENAQAVMKKISAIETPIEEWKHTQNQISELQSLFEMDDGSLTSELEEQVSQLETEMAKKETALLLSGPYDQGNAILAIHSGAGGTESQDWASILMRMYLRWVERKNFKAEIIDMTEGGEAGIKSVTISITGPRAYGYLRSEKGVHRLVRLSPFDAAHRRHTSFALVEVLPELEDNSEVLISPDEIQVEVYKSSGAGGQNVQKNMTAVRIIHLPTGLVATCQNERSQTQNRENAMKVLRARLFEIKQQEHASEISDLKGEFKKVEWGSQIRSYVLHPYQMVKDHRTDYETSQTQAVLDGDMDGLMEAYLRWKGD
ncbi:MAG: peptide chain release factor 2 [Anaerolineaceae bacterium]|nr:peptide chain release factor 2 [Anaerolineaceae bacterium]